MCRNFQLFTFNFPLNVMTSELVQNTSLENIILTILAIVIIIIVVGCIYTFIRAIFLFVFSNSKEENKKKWRNSIRFMIIGILFTIVLLFLCPVLFKAMNVPGYQNYTPQNIFGKAWELINKAFQLWNFIQKSQTDNQFRGNLYYDTNPNNTINTTSPSTTDTTPNYSL